MQTLFHTGGNGHKQRFTRLFLGLSLTPFALSLSTFGHFLLFRHLHCGHLRESRGPPGRKPRKNLQKVFPDLPARSLNKVRKKVEKDIFSGDFRPFQDFLETLGQKAGEDFWRPFRGFRPGGPRDSRGWPAGTQHLYQAGGVACF